MFILKVTTIISKDRTYDLWYNHTMSNGTILYAQTERGAFQFLTKAAAEQTADIIKNATDKTVITEVIEWT